MRALTLLYSILAFGLFSFHAGAQRSTLVFLSEDGEPIRDAHCVFQPLGTASSASAAYAFTDENGKALLSLKGKYVVQVTHVAYARYLDTLDFPGNRTQRLKAGANSLEGVEIEAGFEAGTAKESSFNVRVISQERIKAQGANNLGDVLRNEASISLTTDGATGGTGISLMGLGGEHVKIMIDGIPMIGRVNGNLDLSQINLNNVERIEIIEGPASVVYGTNALGGVINIVTKDFQKQDLNAEANTYYESVGQYNLDAKVGYRRKDFQLDFNGGRYFNRGFDFDTTSRSREWKPRTQYFGNFNYLRRFKKNARFRFKAGLFNEKVTDKGDMGESYRAWDQYFHTDRVDLSSSYSGKVSAKTQLDIRGGYSWFQRQRLTYLIDLTTLDQELVNDASRQDTQRFSQLNVRSTFNTELNNRLALLYGVELSQEAASGDRIDGENSLTDIGVFAGVKYRLLPRLTVNPSLRAIYNSSYNAPITSSVMLKYSLTEKIDVRVSYANGFRAPSLKETGLLFVDPVHSVFGGQNLRAETSNNLAIMASYSTMGDKWLLKLKPSYFLNIIKDQIGFINIPRPLQLDSTVYANVDEFRTHGFRLNADYRRFGHFKAGLGVAYIGRFNRLSDNFEVSAFSYTPEIQLNLGYTIKPAKIEVAAFYKYTGRSPYLVQGDVGENPEELFIPEMHHMDATASRTFAQGRLTLSTGVKNLFDLTQMNTAANTGVHSGGGQRLVGWGRTFFMSARLRLHKTQGTK